MNDELRKALDKLLDGKTGDWTAADCQRHAILMDLLWKMTRSDWHGVCDCSNDLRELHL